MRKKILTIMVVVSAFLLGACTEQDGIKEMLEDDSIELNQTGDPDDDCIPGDPLNPCP